MYYDINFISNSVFTKNKRVILNIIFYIVLVSLTFQIFIPLKNINLLRITSLFSSGIVFFLACLLLLYSDYFEYTLTHTVNLESFTLYFSFGLGGWPIIFLFVSSFLVFVSLLIVWNNQKFKNYSIILTLINLLVIY